MAIPAITGLSSPATASGMAATLYAKAQKRFALIVRSVLRASRIASAAPRRSPETSVRSLASIATSVPVPIAIPRTRLCECGCVVDAVADHGRHLARSLQAAQLRHLLLRQDVGDDALDPDVPGHGPRRALVVAGEEHGHEAERLQLRDRLPARRFDSVGDSEEAEHGAVRRDRDDGVAFAFSLVARPHELERKVDAPLPQERRPSDDDRSTLHDGLHAKTRPAPERLDRRQRSELLAGPLGDRARDGMLARVLGGAGGTQQLVAPHRLPGERGGEAHALPRPRGLALLLRGSRPRTLPILVTSRCSHGLLDETRRRGAR